MVAEPIGVVSEERCNRNPRLAIYPRDCECTSEWPDPVTVVGKERRCWKLPTNPLVADACSERNLQWILPAQEAGIVQIVRQTTRLEEMAALVSSGRSPKQPEVISFRCPKCWRLGMIIVEPKELSLLWW